LSNEYEDIFKDIEPVICPVLTCGLYDVGCTNPLNATVLNNIHVGTKKPWKIVMNPNVEDGITINYCFKCFGDTSIIHPSAQFDNIEVR